MSIFNRNIKKKHIEQFELKIAGLLHDEFPQFKKVLGISKLYGISFTHNPNGIYISRGYNSDACNEIQKNYRTHFNLIGISAFHLKEQSYVSLKLNYSFDSLTRIEIDEPQSFHKNFDLDNLQIGKIEIEQLPNEDPDKETVEKILKALTREQKESLELEDVSEIEFDEKLFYTILDMEDENYIAVDKSGNVYRLNHDHEDRVRKIASKPADFLTFIMETKQN